MNYPEVVQYIENIKPPKFPYDLGRMSAFMAFNNNIQDTLPTIHVAGTNGKGSTVAILASILQASGLKVGTFTGPHILNWTERFHIDGQEIQPGEFVDLFCEIQELIQSFEKKYPHHGSMIKFEYLTAMAFNLFAKHKVDIAIVEVGLGGRLDPTNVLSKPLACAITTIDLDHTNILGRTIEEIARDKAGIIKNNVPIVTGANLQSVKEIAKIAENKNAPLWHCMLPNKISPAQNICNLSLFSEAAKHLALPGSFQILNSLVAYMVLSLCAQAKKIPQINIACLSQGLSKVKWPGRIQYIPSHHLVLDVAHNPAGAKVLRESLGELFPGHSFIFVFAAYENKNYSEMLAELIGKDDLLLASKIDGERPSHDPEQIVDFIKSTNRKNSQATAFSYSKLSEALQAAFEKRRDKQIIVATGSFVTVAETMRYLGWHNVDEGVAYTKTNQAGASVLV